MFNTTEFIKQKSKELGFLSCGISKAGFLEKEAPKLERWLNNNYHGKMSYMANHFDKRLDPTLLVPGAKSVISLLFSISCKLIPTILFGIFTSLAMIIAMLGVLLTLPTLLKVFNK